MYSHQQLAAGAWNDTPVLRDAPQVFIHLILMLFLEHCMHNYVMQYSISYSNFI